MGYMEMNKLFSSTQCGCRRNRTTLDHLVRMENEVRKSIALGEHQVSVFFDIEKPYDMTWRWGILRDLRDLGLKRYLPKYIEKFLKDRHFSVKFCNYVSDRYRQTNGVLQGSVLAVTLFAIKINGIAKLIPQDPRFISSLYVDNLQIGYRHSNVQTITKEMQRCLDRVLIWTQESGFKFSHT